MDNNGSSNKGSSTSVSPEYIGFATAFSFMIMTDLVGNTLVILVIMTNRNMRTSINYVLVNLAVADITVAIFMGIKFVIGPTFIHPDGITGRYLCKFITGGTTAWMAAVASIYTLVAIAVEAYHATYRPFKRRSGTAKNIGRTVFLIWLIALFWGLPLYLSVTYEDKIKTCAEHWPYPILPKMYSFGWIIVAGVIPIAVMCVLYFKVVRRLWLANSRTKTTLRWHFFAPRSGLLPWCYLLVRYM
ncbi:hypothetical protein OS493_003078 [Desmophyllum pertusum]|uniref:G-protein coupled receptors family 1 profile domain-containing protein n=1 Tax=Desmophyllum pertusum TaxID=174260 RepID=A0A9W9YJW4_9CNID|nr:hypothetical protein OS493_003078 [Desmophyllum pertusum]